MTHYFDCCDKSDEFLLPIRYALYVHSDNTAYVKPDPLPSLRPIQTRDPSASLEDWQKLAKTGEIVWFYYGRDRK